MEEKIDFIDIKQHESDSGNESYSNTGWTNYHTATQNVDGSSWISNINIDMIIFKDKVILNTTECHALGVAGNYSDIAKQQGPSVQSYTQMVIPYKGSLEGKNIDFTKDLKQLFFYFTENVQLIDIDFEWR